jgi:diguanylate cyclase (GGDEF)-like protein
MEVEVQAAAHDNALVVGSSVERRVFGVAASAAVAYTITAMVVLLALPQPEAGVAVTVYVGCAGLLAAGCATWAGWRSPPGDRRWRLLAGGALACATLPALGLAKAPSMKGDAVPGISAYKALYPLLLCHPLAMGMLLSIPTTARVVEDCLGTEMSLLGRRWRVVIVLDSMLLVGFLVILSWMVWVRNPDGYPTLPAVIGANTAGNLVLVVTLMLLASLRQPRSTTVFALFAAGLTAYSITKSTLTYAVVQKWQNLPPLVTIGFVTGPLLVALACLAESPARDSLSQHVNPYALWVHTTLPYAALAVIVALLPTQAGAGVAIHTLEALLLGLTLAQLIITMADNTRLLSRIRYKASHDCLTGLANRALFIDRLTHAVTRHAHTHQSLALLFCDLDDFKGVNDSLGHAVGDELLRTVARRLTDCVQPSDTVARMGGDEFAILLDGETDDPVTVGRRVIDATNGHGTEAGMPCAVHASVGLVIVEPEAGPVTPDTVLRQADLAMYSAKYSGKGDLVVYRPHLRSADGAGHRSPHPDS